MAKYVTDVEFKEQVRVCLDQNMSSDALAALEDVDTLSLDDIIESKAEDAALSVLKAAPIHKLGDISKPFDGDISISPKKPYKVSKTLPTGFARLVRFNMESWRYPIHEALPPFTSLYDQANSGFNTFGTKDRPAAFLVPTDEGKKLEVFCASNTADDMDNCRYAAKPKKEERVYASEVDVTPSPIVMPRYGIPSAEDARPKDAKKQLESSIEPQTASDVRMGWSSSDESVVIVSKDGLLTAQCEGVCYVTCKAEDGSGKYARNQCVVRDKYIDYTTYYTISESLSVNQATTSAYSVDGYITAIDGSVTSGKQRIAIDESPDGGYAIFANAVLPEGVDAFALGMRIVLTGIIQNVADEGVRMIDAEVVMLEDAEHGTDEDDKHEYAWQIQLADDLVRPTIYYAAYLTALAIKDDNAAEKLLAIAKAMMEE